MRLNWLSSRDSNSLYSVDARPYMALTLSDGLWRWITYSIVASMIVLYQLVIIPYIRNA